jgi:hypothetical protein
MIVLGVVLMILAWALPQLFPEMLPPFPALCHIGWVVGILLFILGIVFLIFGHFSGGRYTGGRRHLY